MTTISRQAIVPYSPAQMFGLVNDIEAYPLFLPWCKDACIESKTEDEIVARLTLVKSGFQKAFTTCNRLQANKMIEIRLLDGPFHHLEGFWRFEALDATRSKVSLDLEFEIAGKLMSLALGPLFQQVANSFVDLFARRAHDIFG